MPRHIVPKTVIVMVGLPARGKSHIARKLVRYLTWLGHRTQIFNVGNYRRERLGAEKKADFYRPDNDAARQARLEMAMAALRDMLRWLRKSGDIGIYDATNSTRARRELVQEQCEAEGVDVVYLESMCDDEEIIAENVRATKLRSPDYENVEEDLAVKDFRKRIQHYETVYEPVEDDASTYVKIINGGRKFIGNRLSEQLPTRLLFFLVNLRISSPTIWLTRHGESEFNRERRIGGDSALSDRGRQYAKSLSAFFDEQRQEQPLTVWTSSLKRTIQTAEPLHEIPSPRRALNEIDAGVCDGMTYSEIKRERPNEFEARNLDKLRYRYPRGESYEDVIQRLDPIILGIERRTGPLLIISHQAVLRALYGYFMGLPARECPHLSIPLHSVIKLTPNPYGCDEARYPLDPQVPESMQAESG